MKSCFMPLNPFCSQGRYDVLKHLFKLKFQIKECNRKENLKDIPFFLKAVTVAFYLHVCFYQ